MHIVVINSENQLVDTLMQQCWQMDISCSALLAGESTITELSAVVEPLVADHGGKPGAIVLLQYLGSTKFPTIDSLAEDDSSRPLEGTRAAIELSDRFDLTFVVVTEGRDLSSEKTALLDRVAGLERHIILSCDWLFGVGLDGILAELLAKLMSRSELVLDDKVELAPTSVDSAVNALLAILQQQAFGATGWGYYHLESSDRCSEFDFVEHIATYCRQFVDAVATVKGQSSAANDALTRVLDQRFMASLPDGLLHNFGIKQASWRSGMENSVRDLVAELRDRKIH